MAVIIPNRQIIDTPSPGQRRYGLFDAATVSPLEARAIGAGIQYISDICDGTVTVYDQVCGEESDPKPIDEGSSVVGTDPFWLVARKRCGTVGRTAADMQRAVRAVLEGGAQTAVEAVLWDGGGAATGVENLTGQTTTTIVTPLAPGAGAAVAALEAAFYAAYGYVGTIHVNTAAYAAVDYAGLVEGVGGAGALRTPIRSVWSFGAGYGLTGPEAAAPAVGHAWAFMTGPVTVGRSGVLPMPDPQRVMDRTLNQWDVIAEEIATVMWECPPFAVQIPLAAPAVATAPAVPA